jgi:hypothetical protein
MNHPFGVLTGAKYVTDEKIVLMVKMKENAGD